MSNYPTPPSPAQPQPPPRLSLLESSLRVLHESLIGLDNRASKVVGELFGEVPPLQQSIGVGVGNGKVSSSPTAVVPRLELIIEDLRDTAARVHDRLSVLERL